MAAPQNNCFNPKGRPIGAKSKKTLQWEYFAEYCLSEGLNKFRQELAKLEKKDYVNAYLNLMEFFKPKLSRLSKEEETKDIQVIIGDFGIKKESSL